MKFTEFYSELQGRPSVRQSVDPGTGLPTFISNYVLREEFTTMQTDLKDQLAEQSTLLERMLAVITLFASLVTGIDIEEDADD